MAQEELMSKVISGVIWSAIQKYSAMALSLISGIVLSRLLTPADFGSIGMLAIFVGLSEVFIDAGFGSALIQKKNPTQEDFSTVFFFNLLMAAAIYLVLFIGAPYIAEFYNMPVLCEVLRVWGLVLFVYSLNIIQLNQIRKNMQFKKLSVITLCSSAIALSITILLAYQGWGIWALVVQNLLAAIIQCAIVWLSTNWHPSLTFSISAFKSLFSFGFFMFLTHIVRTLSDKISGLIIGRVYSASTMGYYSKASTTEDMASMSISSVLIQVTYPLYSSIQDDREQLKNTIKRITTTLSFVTTPMICILILIAKPLIVILYSETWLPCVPYFQILCVAGLAKCLQAVNYQAISAIGKSKVMFKWELVKRIIDITLLILGIALYGIIGLLWSKVVSTWIAFIINTTMVSSHVGYKYYIQYIDLLPVFIVSGLSFMFSYTVASIFNFDLYMDGLVKMASFFIAYLAWIFIFRPEPLKYLISIKKSLTYK